MARTRVRWGRLALAALALASFVGLLGGRAGAGPAPAVAERRYVVRSGDTVWAIAQRLVGSTGDPRPVADSLIRRNHLSGGAVFPGERLLIPAEAR